MHHHHDNGAICFHVIDCIENHGGSDGHDAANEGQYPVQNNHSCQHDPNCVAETSYYTNPDGKIKIKAPSFDNDDNPVQIQFCPVFYLVSDFLIILHIIPIQNRNRENICYFIRLPKLADSMACVLPLSFFPELPASFKNTGADRQRDTIPLNITFYLHPILF